MENFEHKLRKRFETKQSQEGNAKLGIKCETAQS